MSADVAGAGGARVSSASACRPLLAGGGDPIWARDALKGQRLTTLVPMMEGLMHSRIALVVLALTALAFAGCGSSSSTSPTKSSSSPSTAATPSTTSATSNATVKARVYTVSMRGSNEVPKGAPNGSATAVITIKTSK